MLDDRDLVADGFQCQDCGTPFDDGVGHPRSCQACGGMDESRHDELVRRSRTGETLLMAGEPITAAELRRISADGP